MLRLKQCFSLCWFWSGGWRELHQPHGSSGARRRGVWVNPPSQLTESTKVHWHAWGADGGLVHGLSGVSEVPGRRRAWWGGRPCAGHAPALQQEPVGEDGELPKQRCAGAVRVAVMGALYKAFASSE